MASRAVPGNIIVVPINILLTHNEWFAHNTLIYVFQYLDAQDLLRVSQVCALWHEVAVTKSLWRTVTLKECRLHWASMGRALGKLETRHLRLIDCIFMLNTDYLLKALKTIPTIRRIEFSECSSIFVERLPEATTELEEINLNLIGGFGVPLDLEFLSKLPNLYKVSVSCNREIETLLPLLHLKNTVKYLSLTDVQNLPNLELDLLSMLENLEHLTLGNCWNLPQYFFKTIINLQNITKLRFENCRECHLNKLIEAASQLQTLKQLELIGINVDNNFYKVIALCQNVKKLIIVPNARRLKSADGNTQVVDGVIKLKDTLSSFTLGFTEFYIKYVEKTYDVHNSAPFLVDVKTYPNTVIRELNESELEKFEGVVKLGKVEEFLNKKLPKVKVHVVEWKPKWPYNSYCINQKNL